MQAAARPAPGSPRAEFGADLRAQSELSALGPGAVGAAEVAAGILGQRCWIRWPYLQEAAVEAVSDRQQLVRPPRRPRPVDLGACAGHWSPGTIAWPTSMIVKVWSPRAWRTVAVLHDPSASQLLPPLQGVLCQV